MNINQLKNLIPNSENWTGAKEITFGWSGERKFRITTNNNEKLLLRILSFEQKERQEKTSNILVSLHEARQIHALTLQLLIHIFFAKNHKILYNIDDKKFQGYTYDWICCCNEQRSSSTSR